MSPDPYSLDNLRDLSVPGPVPWWPSTAGWWWLLALLLLAGALGAGWLRDRHRRTAFRREGLARLRELEGATPTARAVSRLLKRVALAAFPRDEVASLSGRDWAAWLSEHSATGLPEEAARVLRQTYSSPGAAAPPELLAFARSWIRAVSPPR